MIGAIIGDIVGSRYEWHNIKTKNFELFTNQDSFTDDSVMTLAIAKALVACNGDYTNLEVVVEKSMQLFGQRYPHCGYGGRFYHWVFSNDPKPYNSFGNGSAMRVSSVAYVAKSLEEVKELAKRVSEVTHNHLEGIKGAQATAVAIYLAKNGKSIKEIKDYICEHYYHIDFTLDEIRPTYSFDVTCQGSVPQALEAFFESISFEDAIRNAISIGGDSDTIAAITGSIAEAYYGVPNDIKETALRYLDDFLYQAWIEFDNFIQNQ